MENTKNSVLNTSLLYGLLLAVSSMIVSIVYYILGMQLSESQQYIGWVLAVVFLVLGILHQRNKKQGGYISYGRALGTGVLISLFAGILIALYFYLYTEYIDTEFLSRSLEKSKEAMAEKGMSDEEIEKMLQSQQQMMGSPLIMFFSMIVINTIFGFLLSLVLSIFLRKEDPSFENKYGTE
jgi:hypothetical protein